MWFDPGVAGRMRCGVADTIKCRCSHCGAKYRLPLEAQGRTARCKRCGEKFEVPRYEAMEETVLTWLTGPDGDEQEAAAKPRVINMPKDGEDAEEIKKRVRGPIRLKTGEGEEQPNPAKAKAK